jgi:iron complex transport system substrate-binding protein
MFHSEPKKLDAFPTTCQRDGQAAGNRSAVANAAARTCAPAAGGAALASYAVAPVRTFYQVWDKPLYTLNGAHIVSDAARLCGGENIFASQKVTAPVVSIEAVLQEDPEAMFSTAEKEQGGAAMWRQYPRMTATARVTCSRIDGNLLNRAGPRMIQGAASLCENWNRRASTGAGTEARSPTTP